jgi:hypothetical protein
MVSLTALLLPIVVAAVAVFIVSSILHMVLKYHRADYRKIPNQEEAISGLAKANLAPGLYTFPYYDDMKDCGTPEAIERFKRGPNGMLTILPNGSMNLGKFLGLWFVFCLIASIVIAYLAGLVLAPGAIYMAVFRFVATAGLLAYCIPWFVDSVWKSQPWANTLRHMFDGLLYALTTAGVFGWLWPR